ncbi:urea amidolyase [Rhodobacteraceae bacterium ASV31]|nr:urea amidolyase [Anianabacter salinae]
MIAKGLSRGGAVDVLALHEGAALLGQGPDLAALEMAGAGGTFRADGDLRIAMTGARMDAALDGRALTWNASHAMPHGAELRIGAARAGRYGYLHVGGGIATEPVLGARAVHLAAGIGRVLEDGDSLQVGPDPGGAIGLTLEIADRLTGGALRLFETAQTGLFPDVALRRFAETIFRTDVRANRQGARLVGEGGDLDTGGLLSLPSEIVLPGDIQITGDGTPFVLLAECQATGGYPRIARVLEPDLPRVAQAGPDAPLRLRWIDRDETLTALTSWCRHLAALPRAPRPLIRDPAAMADLLSYSLVGGVVSATDPEGAP